jgi:aminoglycoside N3'-acetyltransferase
MKYTKQDIINALKNSGIKKDDTVFFSTSLGMVGLPPKEINSQEKLNKLFLDATKEVLTDGRIIVPTYSYTFGKSLASNLATFKKDTPAEIGSFPNFILKQQEAIRSLDPFMSVACIGKNCKELLDGISNISYGEGSFFERLVNLENSKCCSIGLGPNWTPFIHYSDYLAKVPHRYDKLFWGNIETEKGVVKKIPWIYSVRFVGDESYPYAHIAGREAEKSAIWKSEKLGRARIYTASCKEYFEFVMKKLSKNPWYLAKGPAIDVIKKEKERVKYQDIKSNFETGQWVDGVLLPERWNYFESKLIDSKGKIISTTPWTNSLSVNKIVSIDKLKKHTSFYNKNCFYNRDWGFVVKEELKDKEYKVIINSEFGKGKIAYENGFIFAEEWQKVEKMNLKKKIYFNGEINDW